MLKFLGLLLCFSQAYAMDIYPLKFGIGTESCHPNSDGLTECHGISPMSKLVNIPLNEAADGGAFYGYYTQTGKFEKIGFKASITIFHSEADGYDDMLKINLQTWSLANPEIKTETSSEVFADKPENLNRMNFIAPRIGPEEDYSNVILGIERF